MAGHLLMMSPEGEGVSGEGTPPIVAQPGPAACRSNRHARSRL
jgi:hypothetical protein